MKEGLKIGIALVLTFVSIFASLQMIGHLSSETSDNTEIHAFPVKIDSTYNQ
jgi:hypothetical protein